MNATPLAAWMAERNLRPDEVAEKAGVHPVTVYRWRKGEKLPPAERVLFYSSATGIPPHVLRPDLPALFPPPTPAKAA